MIECFVDFMQGIVAGSFIFGVAGFVTGYRRAVRSPRFLLQLNDAREILARVATSHLKDDPDADAIGVRITEFLDE